MKSFRRILDRLANAALWTSAAGLIAMTLTIGWQVFGRKVLNASPAWSESLALLLMLYFVFLAAAVGVREGFHLRFRVLDDLLADAPLRWLRRFTNTLVATFGVLMAVNGVALAKFTLGHAIPTLGVSRALAYLPFVVAGSLIALFALQHIIEPDAHDDGMN